MENNKNQIRLVIGLLILFLLSTCAPRTGTPKIEIEELPGAYTFFEGDTSYPELYYQAVEKLNAGDYNAAEIIYKDLIEKEPGNVNAYIGLGSSLLAQDRSREAIAAYEEALAISPGSVDARIGLGSTYYMLNEKSEALEHYTAAVELDENNPNARWGLALVLIASGEEEEAIEHLEKVIELAPDSQLAIGADDLVDDIRRRDE